MQFIEGRFPENANMPPGITIHRKELAVAGHDIEISVWDFEGPDAWAQYNASFMSGASGLIFVCDSTSEESLAHVLEAHQEARGYIGVRPAFLLVNKVDLSHSFALSKEKLLAAQEVKWTIMQSSAKTGDYVEDAFLRLAKMMLPNEKGPGHGSSG